MAKLTKIGNKIAGNLVIQNADWLESDPENPAYIKNKPADAPNDDNKYVRQNGEWVLNDTFEDAPSDDKTYGRCNGEWTEVISDQADWNETDESAPSYIKNKPEISSNSWKEKSEQSGSSGTGIYIGANNSANHQNAILIGSDSYSNVASFINGTKNVVSGEHDVNEFYDNNNSQTYIGQYYNLIYLPGYSGQRKIHNTVIGTDNSAYHYNSIVLGHANITNKAVPFTAAQGKYLSDDDGFTIAIGMANSAVRNYDMAIGLCSIASGGENVAIDNSVAVGYRNLAFDHSIITGTQNIGTNESVLNIPDSAYTDTVGNHLSFARFSATCNSSAINSITHNNISNSTVRSNDTYSIDRNIIRNTSGYINSSYSVTNNIITGPGPDYNMPGFSLCAYDVCSNKVLNSHLLVTGSYFSYNDLNYSILIGNGYTVTHNALYYSCITGGNPSITAEHNLLFAASGVNNGLWSQNIMFNTSALGVTSAMHNMFINAIPQGFLIDSIIYGGKDTFSHATTVNLSGSFIFNPGNASQLTNSYAFLSLCPGNNTAYNLDRVILFGTNNNIRCGGGNYSHGSSLYDSLILGNSNQVYASTRNSRLYVIGTENTYNVTEGATNYIFGNNNITTIPYNTDIKVITSQSEFDTYTATSAVQRINLQISAFTNDNSYFWDKTVSAGQFLIAHKGVYAITDKLILVDTYSEKTVSEANTMITAQSASDWAIKFTNNGKLNEVKKGVRWASLTKPGMYYKTNSTYTGYIVTRYKSEFERSISGHIETTYDNYVFGSHNEIPNSAFQCYYLGHDNTITNKLSYAISNGLIQGNSNTAADGSSIVIFGAGCSANGHHATTLGCQTIANEFQTVIGKYNKPMPGVSRFDGSAVQVVTGNYSWSTAWSGLTPCDTTTGVILAVGNGYAESATCYENAESWQDELYIHRSNAMIVSADGTISATKYAKPIISSEPIDNVITIKTHVFNTLPVLTANSTFALIPTVDNELYDSSIQFTVGDSDIVITLTGITDLHYKAWPTEFVAGKTYQVTIVNNCVKVDMFD